MNMADAATLDPTKAHVVSDWAHDRPLLACRFDPLGRYVFCGAEDSTVQRFAVADGKRTPLSGGHETWVFALAFTKDGLHAISGGGDGKIVWWETSAEAPQPVRAIQGHTGWIRSMSASPDGTLLATGGNDLAVRLWYLADGSKVREMLGHERHVYCVQFDPTGRFLFTGDLLGVLKQWDASSGELVAQFDAKALHSYNGGQGVDFGGVRGIAVSPDLQYVAAGGLHNA